MHLPDLLPVFVAIPAVPFLMGTPADALSDLARQHGGTRESYREEAPQHTLTLPSYAIAQTPVTHGLYSTYVTGAGVRPPLIWHGKQPAPEIRRHPVVDITWDDALAFCTWLASEIREPVSVQHAPTSSNGAARVSEVAAPRFRMPSEAEWEHAARGTDGRAFPWGNEFDPARANTREGGANATTSVGQYPQGASPYGVLDMAGNVWELTATLDAHYPYDAADGRESPQAAGRRIARGGCYANPHGFARCACRFRFAPTMGNAFLGFRLAFSV